MVLLMKLQLYSELIRDIVLSSIDLMFSKPI